MNATFPKYLIGKFKNNESVECFSDTIYSPTYYKDFMNVLDSIIVDWNRKEKIFHASGEATTRYDFAVAFAGVFGFDTALVRKTSVANRGIFLFPDLSMQNEKTQRVLQVKRTGITDALMDMKKEWKNETS